MQSAYDSVSRRGWAELDRVCASLLTTEGLMCRQNFLQEELGAFCDGSFSKVVTDTSDPVPTFLFLFQTLHGFITSFETTPEVGRLLTSGSHFYM